MVNVPLCSRASRNHSRKPLVPSYRLHSVLARVVIDCTHIYLGDYGTPSQAAYAKLIAERLLGNPLARLPTSTQGAPGQPVSNRCLAARRQLAMTFS